MSGSESQQVRFRGRLGQLFHNGIQCLQSPKYESLASKLTEKQLGTWTSRRTSEAVFIAIYLVGGFNTP